MNVGELKQILNKHDDSTEILLIAKYRYNAHGGAEQWTAYNTISGVSPGRYISSVKISNSGHLDVDIPFLKIDIGGEYSIPIPDHILKQLEDSGEKVFNKNITLT
jgi:hypothetical protein